MRLAAFALVLVAAPAFGSPAPEPAAVRAMKDELARSMDKLELTGVGRPYYLSYELWDTRYASVTATFGSLVTSDAGPHRSIDIDLRVGDYNLDNSNYGDSFRRRNSITLPVDDDYDAIRRDLWLATDSAYKGAGETLERKEAILKQESKDPDEAPSFSKDPTSKAFTVAPLATPDRARLEALVKKLSGVFRTKPDVYKASAHAVETDANRYFVSSEGALAAEPFHEVRITVTVATQADDGMPLHDTLTFAAATYDKLPSEAEMLAQTEALAKELSAFRKAPIVDDYAGPVLFRGIAAAQVVRALLAEEVAGTPAPKGDRPGARRFGESQLVGKVGQRILPVGVTVVDDPTLDKLGAHPLTGHYLFDEEGVTAQRVSLVENGVFKRFLMSRTPRKGFEHSTGHGRSTRMSGVRAHPSNLIVSSRKGLGDAALLAQARAVAKEQELPYVLVVDRLGSFDEDSFDPSLFGSDGAALAGPAIMKRVYPDGREELVRGATFGSVPFHSLKDLLAIGATGTPYSYVSAGFGRMFDGMYDGSSGIAITIVSPALLFRDLDIKKPHGAQRKPPIAPRP